VSLHSLDGPGRKCIKEDEDTYNWVKVSQARVDLRQFKDIITVIFSFFPFKSAEIFMQYLMSNQTDLPRIIKAGQHF